MNEVMQFSDKWTSRQGTSYDYTLVTINGALKRVFNYYRGNSNSISENSEVFNYFKRKLNK